MERLRSRQQTKNDDGFRRRVHSPISTPRIAEGFRPHPSLRLHGQLSTIGIHETVSSAVANGTGRSDEGCCANELDVAVRDLSCPNDRHREADRSTDHLEISFPILLRYIVATLPNSSSTDVPVHAGADVFLSPIGPSSTSLNMQQQFAEDLDEASWLALRFRSSSIETLRPVTTSTRIPVLSP